MKRRFLNMAPSQQFVLFTTYELAQKASVYVLGKSFQFSLIQRSSLFGSFCKQWRKRGIL